MKALDAADMTLWSLELRLSIFHRWAREASEEDHQEVIEAEMFRVAKTRQEIDEWDAEEDAVAAGARAEAKSCRVPEAEGT